MRQFPRPSGRQFFPPNANLIARMSIYVIALLAAFSLIVLGVWFRSNYYRQVHIAVEQPVPFSHQLHNDVLGIECQYCHVSVEQSSFANIPAAETCMTCHAQVAVNSPDLAPVRESYATGQPVEWVKVYDLPDFVYFNHSIHVNKGIGCSSCHGQINQMPVVWQEQALFMGWCLNCHRNPENYVRPRDEIYNMSYVPAEPQNVLGPRLVAEYNIMPPEQLTNCYVCHR
jgi:hypothetical protein